MLHKIGDVVSNRIKHILGKDEVWVQVPSSPQRFDEYIQQKISQGHAPYQKKVIQNLNSSSWGVRLPRLLWEQEYLAGSNPAYSTNCGYRIMERKLNYIGLPNRG